MLHFIALVAVNYASFGAATRAGLWALVTRAARTVPAAFAVVYAAARVSLAWRAARQQET